MKASVVAWVVAGSLGGLGASRAADDLSIPPAYELPTHAPRAVAAAASIPTLVNRPPVRSARGYCFLGGHPAGGRAANGGPWHESSRRHFHPEAPLDTRLFIERAGCYEFVADPTDFGYDGPTWSYFDPHPIPRAGGGWCFMSGDHHHGWEAPDADGAGFVSVGGRYVWTGRFDDRFHADYAFFSFFFRTHYGRYYADQRYLVTGEVAPRIATLPAFSAAPDQFRTEESRGQPDTRADEIGRDPRTLVAPTPYQSYGSPWRAPWVPHASWGGLDDRRRSSANPVGSAGSPASPHSMPAPFPERRPDPPPRQTVFTGPAVLPP